MAVVPVTIVGLETSDDGTSKNVTIVGMASLTGLSVGGGPILPPDKPPLPPWWPGHPEHPIPPVVGGGPILPPDQLPPGVSPPDPPKPGDPVTPLPPPPGGGWPVHGIVPPPYIIVNYPGIGPVVVPPPASAART
jgi:hypothetical protein